MGCCSFKGEKTMTFDLVENALHSLREAISYYTEADEGQNADQFKFSVLLTCHCAELLLKEILVRNHPALIYEDIDKIGNIDREADRQTVGYRLALLRVKNLCGVDLKQYEDYLVELGQTRNTVQHYKCVIDGVFYKSLLSKSFSAIEYLLLDVLHLNFEDYLSVISPDDIAFLHEDTKAYNARKSDIQKEFEQKTAIRYIIIYDAKTKFKPYCPICGTQFLAKGDGIEIHCKFCGANFDNYQDLCSQDRSCLNSFQALRDIGRRKGHLCMPIYPCPKCESKTVVYLPETATWECLSCGTEFSESIYCDECGEPMPADITQIAISDFDPDDYKKLCPECASKFASSDEYINYTLNLKIAGHSSHKATVSGYFCVDDGTLLSLKIMCHC